MNESRISNALSKGCSWPNYQDLHKSRTFSEFEYTHVPCSYVTVKTVIFRCHKQPIPRSNIFRVKTAIIRCHKQPILRSDISKVKTVIFRYHDPILRSDVFKAQPAIHHTRPIYGCPQTPGDPVTWMLARQVRSPQQPWSPYLQAESFLTQRGSRAFQNSMSVRTIEWRWATAKGNLTLRPGSAASTGAARAAGRTASIAVRAVKEIFMVDGATWLLEWMWWEDSIWMVMVEERWLNGDAGVEGMWWRSGRVLGKCCPFIDGERTSVRSRLSMEVTDASQDRLHST